MEIEAVGGWQGGAPLWLDAVFETDLLGAARSDHASNPGRFTSYRLRTSKTTARRKRGS